MQISKTRFILTMAGAFVAGAVLMAILGTFVLNVGGEGLGSDNKLAEIQKNIDKYYLEDYDSKDLMDGAYNGYVEGLGDPYSDYMTKPEYEAWKASATGDYSGVGITFTENDKGNFVVLSIAPDSPAAKADIQEGDLIVSVDGKVYDDADMMSLNIRGEKGTEVKLEIYHKDKIRTVKLIRDIIKVESVSSEMHDGNIGYIKISQFVDSTAEDFAKALKDLESDGAESLVLDLRGNGGGLVDQCLEIADQFLDKGVICYVQDKEGNTDTYDAEDGKTDLETAVLINGSSASASEILAGAMKDNGYEIIGTTSFGKGIIQTTMELDDGTALKLTIMRYLSPNKNSIHKKGIKPTVKIKDNKKTKEDEQLKKAEELLSN